MVSDSVHLNLIREGSNYVCMSTFAGQKLKSRYCGHSGSGNKELAFSGWCELEALKIIL